MTKKLSRVVAVVPARMASSRYPGKPLAPIAGLPMVEHVRRRAELSQDVDDVIVATCDKEIRRAVERAGGTVAMTANTHERCTTRVAEAMEGRAGDIVAIVQGDEPLLRPDAVAAVVKPLLGRDDVDCTNLLSPLQGTADAHDPGIVKAAVDQNGFLLYLTRAPIPFHRVQGVPPVHRQTGIMAFRRRFLEEYVALPETPLERIESVDMLRLLEHGRRILGVVVDYGTVGVDYPKDVPIVEKILRTDARQKELHRRITASSKTPRPTKGAR